MIDETLLEAEEKMDKAVEVAKEDFGAIRTGRATPAMFTKIMVDYYGALTPVNQLASFPRPSRGWRSSRRTTRARWRAIEKAIRDSDLGVNPTNDGNIIRVVFPQLTEERRREYIKVAGQGRGRARSRSATSAATPRRRSTSWSRTARSARTTCVARRRSSTTLTHKHVATDRRAAQAQGSRAARGLTGPMTDRPSSVDPTMSEPPAHPRAGRNLIAATAVAVGLGVVLLLSICVQHDRVCVARVCGCGRRGRRDCAVRWHRKTSMCRGAACHRRGSP